MSCGQASSSPAAGVSVAQTLAASRKQQRMMGASPRRATAALRSRPRRSIVSAMHVNESLTGLAPELREFVERYEAAWNGCETDAMAQLITDDIVWTDPALPDPARGVAQVQEFMRTSFRAFPDLSFSQPDPPAMAASGDLVLWAWHMEGTHRGVIDPPGFAPTGRTMRVDGIDQWTMPTVGLPATAPSTT